MTIPVISAVQWGTPGAPLLVLGPSLGTTAEGLWRIAASHLAHRFHVLAWDLPGHGRSPEPAAPFSIGDLARAVVGLADAAAADSGTAPGSFYYAGDSAGGAVGLQLLLDHPDRVSAATLICTAASFATPDSWRARAATVRGSGTPSMIEHSAKVWFAPGFLDREPERGATLLHGLQDSSAAGYAAVCEALADYDVTTRLGEIQAPVLTIAGEKDTSTPPGRLAEIADAVVHGRSMVLQDVAHLAPIEAPEKVAMAIVQHADGARSQQQVYDAGLAVRRSVLGDEHVDRATAAATELTAEFQQLITRYAWGTIWTRPGLDRRTRSLITITALVARGHHEELAMHIKAAIRNGVTPAEIRETLLQSAIYCGVPDANTAFRIAAAALAAPTD
jgi:3-oxoadipate enol-lactonase/4-carboxymuconolactone decarboxylase